MEDKFFDIRPYTDIEAKEAFLRMSQDPAIEYISKYLNPLEPVQNMRDKLKSLSNVRDFQYNFMYGVLKSVVNQSSDGVTSCGIDNLKDGKCHLLISNHRDIILDPAIIQGLLYENGIHTTEIAVGDNLITSKFIEDITRSNGMIKVVRGGSPREIYTNSTHLSEYLRAKIAGGECSAWIAQRNGRTKDGLDQTSQGLVKMLLMSGTGDFAKDFISLNILPISISYQYEPCDFYKTREIFISRRMEYCKKPGEDLTSMITGLTQYKGKIHYEFSPTLSENDIYECAKFDKNERFKSIAKLIDRHIISNYKLWNTNYIAKDILNGTLDYSNYYSQEEKEAFLAYMDKGISAIISSDISINSDENRAELEEIFLSIYANPIVSKSVINSL